MDPKDLTAGKIVGGTSITWFINDVYIGDKNRLLSPVFATSEMKWRLVLYFRGLNGSCEEDLGFFIENPSEANVMVDSIKILILNNNKLIKNQLLSKHNFPKLSHWGYKSFITRNTLKNNKCISAYNKLTILIKVIFQLNPIQFENKTSERETRLKEFDDFEKVLLDDQFSDITFIVEEKQLRAHQVILAARSEVFKAMFTHEMKEKKENEAEIADIKYLVFKELLRFIYVGKVEDIETIVEELLVAADKYSVKGLKNMCEKIIIANLNTENAIRCLSLADSHNLAKLKFQTVKFIVSNLRDVVNNSQFKLFGKLDSDVIYTVVQAIAQNKKS